MNVYAITDATGSDHALAAGVDFASYVQRIDSAVESAANHGAPIGSYVPNSVQIAYATLDGFDDNLLARWKITRTVVADPTPPVVRPELPKSTVIARLNAISKLNPVYTILQSDALAFAQWFSPDWPNVYCDDAGMLAILGAAGLTSGDIATVTAPLSA